MVHRSPLTGLVLCGGTSRRMGRDKATLEHDGRRWIERTVELLDGVCDEVLLACGATPRYADLGRGLVLDEGTDLGPLAGLAAGLDAARHDRVLAVAVDMQALDRGTLVALAAAEGGEEADVVAYEVAGRPEPLCAVYHRRVLPAIRAALAAGRRRMIAFWDGARADGTPLDVRRVPGDAHPLSNWNRPEDVPA
jgi:molybdopterin-guanine dinucleotide biosynthesis protein A